MPTAEVAAHVAEAIANKRFWILTHEDMRTGPVERMQRAAAENPSLLPAGAE